MFTDPAIVVLGIYPMAILNTVAQNIYSEVYTDTLSMLIQILQIIFKRVIRIYLSKFKCLYFLT